MRSFSLLRHLLTAIVGAGILITWAQAEAFTSGHSAGSVQLGMGLTAIGACLTVASQVTRRRGDH